MWGTRGLDLVKSMNLPATPDSLPDYGFHPGMDKNTFENKQAELTRSMYDDYLSRYLPIERKQIAQVSNPNFIADSVNNIRSDASAQFDNAQRMQNQNLARYGVNLTSQQRDLQQRQNALNKATGVVDAYDQGLQSAVNRRDQITSNLINYGRETSGDSLDQIGQNASIEQQRNARNKSAQAAYDAQNRQMLGQFGGMAAMALVMSSKKVKKNIKPQSKDKSYSDINSINLKQFKYKADDSEQKIGQIAEDAPQSIQSSDGQHVQLDNWVAQLTGAVQKLSDKVESLEKSKKRGKK